MDELDLYVQTMTQKYSSLIHYFGEESNLSCQEFFSMLSKFMQEFVNTRETVERLRKTEEKNARIEAAKKAKADA